MMARRAKPPFKGRIQKRKTNHLQIITFGLQRTAGRAPLDHLVSTGEKRGGLRDQLRRKPWPRRPTSWTSITSIAGAILVNAPTLGGWYLLQGQAVAISRTTGIYALLFSGLSRREGERCEIGVARIKCSDAR
ncbi:hypothetical protein SAMN05443247_02397 [Bradyrhizobium erythrophlei]|nr:hypothetical protein SAMN05443247_02397 [Bradyrhizobium erythrophlei]